MFYVEYDTYTGSLISARGAVEYNPWKHLGLGVGIDSLRFSLEADDPKNITGFDLQGTVDFGYIGFYLYGRVFF